MKKLLIAAGALMLALPVQAGTVILPNLYAREYCSLRELGVNSDEATRAAMMESTISGTPVKVTINGREYDHDVVKAARAVRARCPQFLN